MKLILTVFLLLFSLFGSPQSIQSIDKVNNQMVFKELIKNLEGSKSILLKNISDAASIAYRKGMAVSHSKLAIVYSYLKESEKAYASTIISSNYYKEINDFIGLAESYADLGYVIKDIDLNKGLEYFRKAISLGKKHELGGLNEKIYNNYGVLQKMIPDLDSALFYHQSALVVAKKYNLTHAIPYDLNNIAVVYSQKKMYDKAFEALRQSDEYRRKENNDMNWADNLAYRADLYYDMKVADSAIKYYSQSLDLAKKTNFQNLIKFCLERLSELHETKNEPDRALFYFKLLKAHNDSILTIETNNTIATLEEEFDVANKEQQIAEQNVKMLKQKNGIYLILGVFMAALVIGLWFFSRLRRRKKEELAKIQFEKEIEKANFEKEFIEEKLRISRELHDNIGSQLTFMISSVDNLVFVEKKEEAKNRLEKISNFGRSTMKELRSTIWAMKNDGGNHSDLITKINELKLHIPGTITVDVIDSLEGNIILTATRMLNLYRMVQEALQNVVKYAKASEVKIIFSQINNRMIVEVTDNGVGFDTSIKSQGNGLYNMKKRCEEAEASFSIDSSDKGTTIRCEFEI